MAKVNFGTLASDARGKINGIVYSKNKSGSYTRRKVTPANPNTPAQSGARSGFSVLSKGWSATLTALERAAWVNYANTYPRLDVFGNSIKITGANMNISLNRRLQAIGQPTQTAPPFSNVVTPIPFDPTTLAAASGPNSLTFQQTAIATGGFKFYVFGAKPLPAGRQAADSEFRFLGTLSGVAGPYPASVDATALYTGKFGGWVTGQNISLLVSTIGTGTGLTTVGTKMSAISS